jgi:hypothetical protein
LICAHDAVRGKTENLPKDIAHAHARAAVHQRKPP